jgi:hypothetical protein
MADYQLTATESVIRTADMASIPNDPANRDRQEYEQWLADGGVPDPYIEPEPVPPTLTQGEEVLFDHENRLRAIEGKMPMPKEEFLR